LLKELGHRVRIEEQFNGQSCDLLIALHARRSADSIEQFSRRHPEKPLFVTLTGTDLYRDIKRSARAQRSLKLATHLLLLQSHGMHAIDKRFRDKCRVVYQSVPLGNRPVSPLKNVFEVTVIGHLRTVKDPFRAAMASRLLPESSRVRIVHIGAALSESMRKRAKAEMLSNPRYRWLGELPRWKTQQRLARSRLLVLSSKLEGGANVVSEALAAGVPVVSSRISGSLGMLGEEYPGFFEVGDTKELAGILSRVETDSRFLSSLKRACKAQAHLIDPARETKTWRGLLREFGE